MSNPVFFQPAQAWLGDVIPYYYDGAFWLYYLLERRDGSGVPWNLVRTTNFVDFEDLGVALPTGGVDAADFNAFTGSIVEADGIHHLFYTGHNPRILDDATRTPLQVVMHATSEDGMKTWTKHPADTFTAPGSGYERCDWRDPFVFRTDDEGPWRMLLAARTDHGPDRRRGLIAQCISDDLKTWRTVEPFWSPGLYITHECPDVFRIGSTWYLMYSEFSERYTTRYRIADSPDGPWRVPEHDTVDGRAFYAAKTVSDGERRFAVGWIATREDDSDDGLWQWAGAAAVHEVTQAPDRSLRFSLPHEIRESFSECLPLHFVSQSGSWVSDDDSLGVEALDGWACTVAEHAPAQFLLSLTIDLDGDSRGTGVVLRSSPDGEEGYQIRLEPKAGRVTFDRWPRQQTGPLQWQISGDVPHVVELERQAELPTGKHQLDIIVDGTACIVYLDEAVAMSTRLYDRTGGGIGLFVSEGSATFSSVTLRTRPS